MFKKVFPSQKFDFSFLEVDMHSHLLPSLDDGLQSAEESLLCFYEMQALGFRKFICTPHVLSGIYNNKPANIIYTANEMKKNIKAKGWNIEVEAAAEYMLDDEFDLLVKRKEPLLSWGKNYILIEMSSIQRFLNINEIIFELLSNGYQPVLAHPERYFYYFSNLKNYQDLKDRGCLLQMNLLSLSGYYGKNIKNIAIELIDRKMIDFAGTDLHNFKHLKTLQAMCYDIKLMQKLTGYSFLNSTL